MNKINRDVFLFAYQGPNGTLNDSQKAGMLSLIDFLEADTTITDPRHAAYMLATVRHECAGAWQPIGEFDNGKGHTYGRPDPVTGKAYYGRGYVQLTWSVNYKEQGAALGIDLYHDPDRALEPSVAYQIMSRGMRLGMFTGVGLNHFISGETCDYLNARKIINGLDCAQRIAGYAIELETILKEAAIAA